MENKLQQLFYKENSLSGYKYVFFLPKFQNSLKIQLSERINSLKGKVSFTFNEENIIVIDNPNDLKSSVIKNHILCFNLILILQEKNIFYYHDEDLKKLSEKINPMNYKPLKYEDYEFISKNQKINNLNIDKDKDKDQDNNNSNKENIKTAKIICYKDLINIIEEVEPNTLELHYRNGLPKNVDTTALFSLVTLNIVEGNKIEYFSFPKIKKEKTVKNKSNISATFPNKINNNNTEDLFEQYDLPIYTKKNHSGYSIFASKEEKKTLDSYLKKKKSKEKTNKEILAKFNLNSPEPKKDHFFCQICGMKFLNYKEHTNSKEHFENMEKNSENYNKFSSIFNRIDNFWDKNNKKTKEKSLIKRRLKSSKIKNKKISENKITEKNDLENDNDKDKDINKEEKDINNFLVVDDDNNNIDFIEINKNQISPKEENLNAENEEKLNKKDIDYNLEYKKILNNRSTKFLLNLKERSGLDYSLEKQIPLKDFTQFNLEKKQIGLNSVNTNSNNPNAKISTNLSMSNNTTNLEKISSLQYNKTLSDLNSAKINKIKIQEIKIKNKKFNEINFLEKNQKNSNLLNLNTNEKIQGNGFQRSSEKKSFSSKSDSRNSLLFKRNFVKDPNENVYRREQNLDKNLLNKSRNSSNNISISLSIEHIKIKSNRQSNKEIFANSENSEEKKFEENNSNGDLEEKINLNSMMNNIEKINNININIDNDNSNSNSGNIIPIEQKNKNEENSQIKKMEICKEISENENLKIFENNFVKDKLDIVLEEEDILSVSNYFNSNVNEIKKSDKENFVEKKMENFQEKNSPRILNSKRELIIEIEEEKIEKIEENKNDIMIPIEIEKYENFNFTSDTNIKENNPFNSIDKKFYLNSNFEEISEKKNIKEKDNNNNNNNNFSNHKKINLFPGSRNIIDDIEIESKQTLLDSNRDIIFIENNSNKKSNYTTSSVINLNTSSQNSNSKNNNSNKDSIVQNIYDYKKKHDLYKNEKIADFSNKQNSNSNNKTRYFNKNSSNDKEIIYKERSFGKYEYDKEITPKKNDLFKKTKTSNRNDRKFIENFDASPIFDKNNFINSKHELKHFIKTRKNDLGNMRDKCKKFNNQSNDYNSKLEDVISNENSFRYKNYTK